MWRGGRKDKKMTKYLACPLCGGDNLHHVGMLDFSRPFGEDKPIRVTSVTPRCVSVTDDAAVLAPTRRNWLRIFFECETCEAKDEKLHLEISQYKGETRVSWCVPGYTLDKEIEVRSDDNLD